MNGSFIKIPRSKFCDPVFTDPERWKLFTYCIQKANFKDDTITRFTGRGFTEFSLLRGQFVTSREELARELNIPPSTVRNKLRALKKLNELDYKATKQGTIITICNYDNYQGRSDVSGQPSGQQKDDEKTTIGPALYKKEKNYEENEIATETKKIVSLKKRFVNEMDVKQEFWRLQNKFDLPNESEEPIIRLLNSTPRVIIQYAEDKLQEMLISGSTPSNITGYFIRLVEMRHPKGGQIPVVRNDKPAGQVHVNDR